MGYFENICHGFKENSKKGVVFYTIPSFSSTGLVNCCFSSRIGGVSEGCFESLCFSLSREKDPGHFRENTRRLSDAAGIDYDRLTAVNYEHGDGIYVLREDDNGKGITRETDLPKCDALVCESPDTAAMTMHADCVPVFMMDKKTGICAAAHAGWKGTAKKLPGKLAAYFTEKEGSRPEDLLAAVGPHIKSCCFEVGSDVWDVFMDGYGERAALERNGKLYVDLEYAIVCQFESAGIPAGNVTVSDMCTFCDSEHFYSHRRDHGKTGAMAGMIQMK